MALPRILSRRGFQIVALVALLGAISLGVQLVASDAAVFRWMSAVVGGRGRAMVLLPLVLAIGWAIAILPVRAMSWMPTLREDLAAHGVTSLSDLEQLARARAASVAADAEATDPVIRRRHHRRAAAGAVLVVIVFGFATAANLAYSDSVLLLAPPAFALGGLVALAYHLVCWAFGGRGSRT
jgi:hypothetical protein